MSQSSRSHALRLRGKWSPQIRRKVSDSAFYSPDPGASWASILADEMIPDLSPSMLRPTRVVHRGEHRDFPDPGDAAYSCLDLRICARVVSWDGAMTDGVYIPWVLRVKYERAFVNLPRWRRGELRHAEQRRERASHKPADCSVKS